MPLQINTTQIREACSFVINFSGSLLYGKSGTYRIWDIPVEFKKRGSFVDGVYKTLINTLLLVSDIFLLRLCYMFVHEMGHAIAAKILTGESRSVIIGNSGGKCKRVLGTTVSDRDCKIISAAGPLAGTLFTCTQLFLAAMLFSSSCLVAKILYLGAVTHMLNDFWYLIHLGLMKDSGDWGKLRKKGLKSFFLAASAMTVLYALGFHLYRRRFENVNLG